MERRQLLKQMNGRVLRRVGLLGLVVIAILGDAGPAAPQAGAGQSDPRFYIAAEGAVSLREFNGVRIAQDLTSYGLRVEMARREGFRPWVDAARFERPDLGCVPSIPCKDAGWLARGGLVMPLSRNENEPGLHPSLRVGLGASFTGDTDVSYLVGLGAHWRRFGRLAPFAGFRWERVVGINFAMFGAGLRVDL